MTKNLLTKILQYHFVLFIFIGTSHNYSNAASNAASNPAPDPASMDLNNSYNKMQVTSMLILDDILPQKTALRDLRETLSTNTIQVENIKKLESFDAVDVAQRRLEYLYNNGYFKGPSASPVLLNISSKAQK